MTDPQPKPLAEAREDREKIARAIQALPTIAAKLRQDGLTLAAHGVDEALSIIRALSASPAPETDALRYRSEVDALNRVTDAQIAAAEQAIWERSEDREGWPILMYREDVVAAIHAALHTGGEGKGETAVQTPTAWMRDRDGGLRDYSLTQPSGEGWYPLYRKPQVIMRERMPFSFEPSSTPATATGETDLQWEIEKAFRLFYNLTVTPEAWTALSTLRHELQNLKHAKHPIGTRAFFGRVVREAWIAWAQTQPNPKPTWLVPYDQLAEPDKEADRQIGEAVRARSQPPVPRAADAEGWRRSMAKLIDALLAARRKADMTGKPEDETAFANARVELFLTLAAVRPKDAGAKP